MSLQILLEFLEILAGTTDIRKDPKVLKRFAAYYNDYMYALRPNDSSKRTVSRSGDRIKQFKEFVGEDKADDIIQAASDEGLIKIRDTGGLKTVKAEGDEFIKQNHSKVDKPYKAVIPFIPSIKLNAFIQPKVKINIITLTSDIDMNTSV